MNTSLMTEFEFAHMCNWISGHIVEDEQTKALSLITKQWEGHAEYYREHGKTWREIYDAAKYWNN